MTGHSLLLVLAFGVLAGAGGCREEGTAEKTGRRVDEAIDDLRHPNEGPLEELGRKADQAIEDAQKAIEEERERHE